MDFKPRWHSITEVKLYRISTSTLFQWVSRSGAVESVVNLWLKCVRQCVKGIEKMMKNDDGEKAFSEITTKTKWNKKLSTSFPARKIHTKISDKSNQVEIIKT